MILLGRPVEQFGLSEVYERDNGICQLCERPVDLAVRRPDLDCASLDHVIPVSKGGAHTFGNVQLAHLGCNMRKGAKLVPPESKTA